MKKYILIFLVLILTHCESKNFSLENSGTTQKVNKVETTEIETSESIEPLDVYLSYKDKKEKYLIGDYSPNPTDFISYKDKVNGRTFSMRKDVFKAFQEMNTAYSKYAKENQLKVTELHLRSAFRSYNDQKYIWESKFTGRIKMSKSILGKTDQEKVQIILEYSSAPGTSRHHWGTDLDLNSLNNSYFKEGGDGFELYQWLLKNASNFGFCQPYTEWSDRNNKGYYEERWHWSYKPISSVLLSDWNHAFKNNQLGIKKHLGDEHLSELREVYVNSINPNCK